MSSIHQQQGQPQMLPAVQNTGQEQRGCSNEPQNASDVEAQMAQQARQTIRARLKMANVTSVIQVRLMNNINLYKSDETHGFNKHFVTKLLRNYSVTLQLSKYLHPHARSKLVYNGELQPYTHKATCDSYCEWKHLPKKVEKNKNALQTDTNLMKEDLENVLVGSVEEFQGKEFTVTLVSTVHSNPKLTKHNQQFTRGFVDNENRFNVAMSRARALLIVVGDPRLLNTNQIWNKFIQYCCKEGGYRGITVSDT